MSRDARLAVGRVLAVGFRLWYRRFVLIHVVAAVCLAPLVLVPERGDRITDGTIQGLYGLSSTAWVVSFDFLMSIDSALSRNAVIAYLAQLAVATMLVRDAHARVAARPGRRRIRAMLGLVAYGVAGLAVFVALDLAAAVGFRDASPLAVFLAVVAASVVQLLLAARFCLALPAAAVDGFGFLAALGRSGRLGRGSRFRIVLPLILLLALQVGISMLISRFGNEPWLFAVPGMLFLTLKACVLAATYREICLIKEGLPPEEVGAIFA